MGGHLLQERQACLVDCPSQPEPAYTPQSPSVSDQDDDNDDNDDDDDDDNDDGDDNHPPFSYWLKTLPKMNNCFAVHFLSLHIELHL